MTQIDLVIRNGMVADGTGGPLLQADIAVHEGRIVAVGQFDQQGREEIDASNLLVTPGFIDLHTHFDGQLAWSDSLDPSSAHGVTTVVAGNCGVGFAPCRPAQRDALVRLMEGVEDIPEIVMTEGLSWNWESFADFLDVVDTPHDIDFAVLLPHTPLRLYVMGERAVRLEPSTEQDRVRMRQLAEQAIDAGACGFSTSRSIFHRASDGSAIPSLRAEEAELKAIGMGLKAAGRGVIQAITMTGENNVQEYELLHRVALATGRPLSYTLLELESSKNLWRDVVKAVERDVAAGAEIRMQVFNRPVGVILGLEASLNPFCMHPYYVEQLQPLPHAQRVEAMRKPEVRAILLQPSGELQHPLASNLRRFSNMFAMGEVAEYEPDPSQSVAALAKVGGVSPYAIIYDALMAQDGRGKLLVAATNFADGNLDSTLELMQHERAVVALGDGGAHYGLICDASYPTYMLTHWARDRQRGAKLEVSEAVRMLTDAPARLQGFKDRGRLEPGLKADINLIDLPQLQLYSPSVVYDLPAGGKRLRQSAAGYVATYVSGIAVRRNGRDTGARPGRLLRNIGASAA